LGIFQKLVKLLLGLQKMKIIPWGFLRNFPKFIYRTDVLGLSFSKSHGIEFGAPKVLGAISIFQVKGDRQQIFGKLSKTDK